ncbi:MAG: sensor histidine kinase [Longimicrobiales bacterium]
MAENIEQARARPWLWYALAWTPPWLLYAVAVSVQPETTWWHGLISSLVIVGAAALGGVLVWQLSGRVSFPGRSRIRFALIHLSASMVYGAFWLGVMQGWLVLVATREIAAMVMRQAGLWQFSTGIYVYGLIAGVSYLLRTQRQLRERETATARAEAAAAHAQLHSLRSHLQPHFLFNALHAVGSLVRTDPAAADRAIEQLGGLLRHALDHSHRESVPLGKEWEFVLSYLALEQLRLGERLRLDCDLEPAALDVLVPPFLLQPLIENAVRHGIAHRPEGGTIRVSAQRRNGTLALQISDDGAATADPRLTAGTGFGLEGVRQQIDALYGGRGVLNVQRLASGGFAVTLNLPLDAEGA